LFGPQPPGAAIGRHGRPTYGPSPLGVPPPALDLNFMSGALDPAVTFSRADTTPVASYTDATGLLRYGPTNLFLRSTDFSNASWAKNGCTLSAAVLAPDGTTTAYGIISNAANNGYLLQAIGVVAGTTVTLSAYVKAANHSTCVFFIQGNAWADVQARSGTFTLTGSGSAVAGGGTASATITPAGNGWYRCALTATPDQTVTVGMQMVRDNTNGADGTTVQLYGWGAQAEVGPSATNFITTAAAAASGPRFDYSPNTVTNYIRNSTMVGGAAGTFPTFWAQSQNTGLTPTIIGTGTESGINYIDIRVNGTATAGNNNIFLDSGTATAAALNGQTWTQSVYLRIVGGSTTNISTVLIMTQMKDAAQGALGSLNTDVKASLNGNALSTNRLTSTVTLNQASIAFVLPVLQINPASAAVDITLRIGAPQLELSATAGAFVPTSGVAASAGATLRGLLIEEARTNLLFPSADLATLFTVAGTTLAAASGTAPDGSNTMTRLAELAGTSGHYAGKSAVTVTASATYSFSLFAQAQQNQYLQLEYDDGAGNGCFATFDLINGTISGALTVRGTGTATGASIQRASGSIYRCSVTGVAGTGTAGRALAVLSNVANPGFAPSYAGNASNGLLIWGAQLEVAVSGIPTSYIPTTTAVQARAADFASTPLAPPLAFSVTAEAMVPVIPPPSILLGFVAVDDGTSANRVPMRIITGSQLQATAVVASVSTATSGNAPVSANTVVKGAYVSNGGASTITFAANGTTYPVSSGAQPIGLTTMRVGMNNAGGNWLDGWVRRVRYWPMPLTNQQLVQVTT
jgi:hypothetical protein